MAFPEDTLTYLGATIQSLNCGIGWGSSPSSLSINLVEADDQKFIQPTIGMPTYFDYNGWKFGGIVQKWSRNRGSSGFTYEVILNDPRQILSGTQVILFGYTGMTFGLPNIYNVYGYLETVQGFGASGATSDTYGMNARLAIQILQSLINTTPISFLGHNYYLDLTNLYNICGIDYRISGSSKYSVMEMITSISEDAISDYFIRLEYRNGQNWIVPYFISRANPPVFSAIENFINTAEVTYGTISNSVGRELISDPTSKMIVGGQVCKMYGVEQNLTDEYLIGKKNDGSFYYSIDEQADIQHDWSWVTQPDTTNKYIDWRGLIKKFAKSRAETATIWPYWGHDANGNLVIGYGYPNSGYAGNGSLVNREVSGEHKMIIDGRPIAQIIARSNNGIVDPLLVDYLTDVGELSAAMEGFDEWIRYILLTSIMPLHHNRTYEVKSGFQFAQGNTPLSTSDKFITKAEKLKIVKSSIFRLLRDMDYYSWVYATQLRGAADGAKPGILINASAVSLVTTFMTSLDSLMSNLRDPSPNHPLMIMKFNLEEIHGYLRSFAEKHLGVTYMVRTPSIGVRRNTETNELEYSVTPVEGGYFDEATAAIAAANNILPQDINKLLTSDFRIKSYVRYTNGIVEYNGRYFGMLDPSEFGNDVITNINNLNPNNPYDEYYYVAGEVEPTPVFLDNSTLDSPRFVIKLPKPMRARLPKNWKQIHTLFYNIFYNEFVLRMRAAGSSPVVSEIEKSSIWGAVFRLLGGYVGSDGFINSQMRGPRIMPDFAAIALESKTERYGPWFVEGLNGNTEFVEEDTLNPWTYGGYAQMNAVANAMLLQAAANRVEVETGNIEFPGAPTFLLGDAMVANGPIITNINVAIGSQGVTTSYTLSTWTPQFGVIPKTVTKQLSSIAAVNNKTKQAMREAIRGRNISSSNVGLVAGTSYDKPRSKSMHSSMTVLGGAVNNVYDDDGNIVSSHSKVAALPAYYLENQTLDAYEDKAFVSLDALFRPFKTDPEAENVPHLEESTVDTVPKLSDLNPYTGRHDTQLISKDVDPDTTTEDNLFSNDEETDLYVKGIAIKTPIVLTGYGYDIDDKPIPANPDNPDEFLEDYRMRQDKWKTGPLYVPWDDERKMWVAGGGSNLYLGITKQNIYGRGSGLVDIYDSSEYPTLTVDDTDVMVYDFILKPGDTLYSNSRVILAKIKSKYFIVNAECPSC